MNASKEGLEAGRAARRRGGRLTVPNVLCVVRLLAAPALVVLAWHGLSLWCLALAVVLLLMDWVDGKLAKLLKQETVFGARLDSFADAALYGCLALALFLLRGELIRREALWIIPAVFGYVVSVAAGWVKYRRTPSYHTRTAKTSWLLMTIAVVAVLAGWSVWPLRAALAATLLANLEAVAMTLILPEWRANVPSVFHALRIRRTHAPRPPAPDAGRTDGFGGAPEPEREERPC